MPSCAFRRSWRRNGRATRDGRATTRSRIRSRRALDLRRDGDDADVRPRRRDLLRMSSPVHARSPFRSACASGLAPRGLAPRQAQALGRLRALEFRIDEVALEMRGQHARAAGRTRGPRGADARQHLPERRGIARDRRRAEGRHAVARKPLGHRGDRRAAVERVGPLDAVDVDVDEAGDDVVIGEGEVDRLAAAGARPGRRSRRSDRRRGRACRRRARGPGSTRSAPERQNHGGAVELGEPRGADRDRVGTERRELDAQIVSSHSGGRRRAHSWRTGSSMRSAAATLPLTTTTSGSIAAASVATAMPMYLAVSRTTEMATPSPRARALEHESPGDCLERSAGLVEHARAVAGLDAPRQPARDPLGRHFRGEAAELAIVLALDRVQREPGRRRRRGCARRSTACRRAAGRRTLRRRRAGRRRGARRWPRRSTCSAAIAAAPGVQRATTRRAAGDGGTSGCSIGARDAGDRRRRGRRGVADGRGAASPVAARRPPSPRSSTTTARAWTFREIKTQAEHRCATPPCAARAAARARLGVRNSLAVHAREQPPEPSLVRHREHDHARALVRGKLPVVQVVAIERHQRAPELPRQPVVLDVARAPQVVDARARTARPIRAVSRMKPTTPSGMFASAYTRGWLATLFDDRSQLRRECSHQR